MDSTSISTLAKFILPHCLFWNYPTGREQSINISLHKGKCTALERGNDKGHEFSREGGWEHPTTTMGISNIQFGFTPGRNTTDAIFIVRQLQNRFHAVNKTLCVAFVYLEKSFECVPRYVNLWAHRRFDVEECLVQPIQSKHDNVMSRLYVGRNLRGDFRVKIGVHQGFFQTSYCSSRFCGPFSTSFVYNVPVKKAWLQKTRSSSPNRKRNCNKSSFSGRLTWKERASGSTWANQVLISGLGLDMQMSEKFPCAIYHNGVGTNSFFCGGCSSWVTRDAVLSVALWSLKAWSQLQVWAVYWAGQTRRWQTNGRSHSG